MRKVLAAGLISLAIAPGAFAQSADTYDPNNNVTTAQFLAGPCASFSDDCYGLIWKGIAHEYWGCPAVFNGGPDQPTAAKATYDWLKANMPTATSWWLTDMSVAFHAAYPACGM